MVEADADAKVAASVAPPTTDGPSVVIIGGGVIAAASAFYLAQRGFRVRIVEAQRFGRGSSHGNCGYVSPSHVLPLAAPGAIKKVLKAMVRGDGALAIRPRIDPSLWSWLLHFAGRCRREAMLKSAAGRHALLQSSKQLYQDLVASGTIECEWEDQGLLFVYNSRDDLDRYAEVDALVSEHFGISATRYDSEELTELEPALKPGLAGAWRYDCDSHLRPDRLMASWRRALENRGVEIIENAPVESLTSNRGVVTSLHTSQGAMSADLFVLAAGARSPQLACQLGIKLPIQPGKGYSITMARPAIAPKFPMILEEYHVGITPWASGYRIGSTMEFAGYDETLNPRRLAVLRKGAAQCLREPFGTPVEEEWCGWRPMTYDGLPCIGPATKMNNLFIAAGHGMLGVSMAPGTGRLLAEQIAGETPHIDPAPYSPDRFA